MAIISKNQMSEEDIKLQYITPALTDKWDIQKITMETNITDGKINLKGNFVTREKPKRADYMLYLNANNPIAIIEAKDNKHSISHGLQQAMSYAKMLDIPFAYSSNGDGFYEHDFLTGQERKLSLEEFPTEEELYSRYKKEANNEEGISENQEKMIQQPYYSSQKTYPPRYYQRIAINRTVDAISRGKDRLLLVMATGTGKTYTAFQIVYRLLKSGMKSKILYLADRNNLVDQSIQQDFAPLEKVIHKVNFSKDDPSTITSYQVYFSLYQQLAGGNDDQEEDINNTILKLKQLFRPDFFDLIIVDECHRGSAKKESNWRKILEYFASATQIGMTATPKETKYISNIDYFGEPIYTYSLKEGIEDGFLAPFKVINVMTDIGEGWRPRKGQCDIYGNEIEDRIYTNSDYDYNIIIEDRIQQVAAEITNYLKSTDRMAKTIVFCATEDAAERMRVALVNQNSDMVQKNPDYVVRITGIGVIDELDLTDYEESHAFGEIYETILKELQSAGSSGEFYTPRAVTDFMAQMIKPQIGEKMADFACGTGGFITSWLKELKKKVKTTEDEELYANSIYGIEKKQFPYMLCITNMLLHDLDVPQVFHDNTLLRDVLDYTEDDQVDVILMNPPYGGSEKTEVKNHFPSDLASSETADLFMSVIMYRLKEKGRAAVILPDGFLFGTDNAKVAIKTKLFSEFNVHTIVRMPGSVFSPYTSITTNILFFDRNGTTKETWFYRLDMPEGYKHFSKTKPMKLEHFAPVVEWWDNRQEIQEDGFDKAKKYSIDEIKEKNYNIDLCGYPHEEEEILPPKELIQQYQEKRASLNADIDRILAQITDILGIDLEEN